MHLIERIERKLDDLSTRIDPSVFEQCATDLLSDRFPTLIPISGGSDSGRDADWIQDPDKPPIRMAITSSRSYEGARKNLRTSMKSLKQHGMRGRSVVSVSLAALNQAKRKKLEELAIDHGFSLVTVVDRAFFAQALRTNGDWRSKLLDLPGGPFSLSTRSGYGRLERPVDELIGRTVLVELLTNLESDALVWGPPGIGKSTVLEKIPALYFVEGMPSDERLLDDIQSVNPKMLAVDDASKRVDLLDRLLQIRKHESLSYLIVAVSWPHQREEIALHLAESTEVEVELLTRHDIAAIVRGNGITDYGILARVLDQARGRPGWAVRLVEILKTGSEWQSVYTGEALRGEVKTYLLRAGLPRDSLQLLAVIGMLGWVTDSEIGKLARELGIPRPQLARTLNDIAVGGLLDVRNAAGWGRSTETSYHVAPEILGTSIVSALIFADEVPPISAEELFEGWPMHRLEIATMAVRAALVGSNEATTVARTFFSKVVDDSNSLESRNELFRHYLHLGWREAREVLDLVIERWRDLAQLPDVSSPDLKGCAEGVVEYIAEAITDVDFMDATKYAVEIGMGLEVRGIRCDEFLKRLVDSVRGFGPDGSINLNCVVELWKYSEHKLSSSDAAATNFRIQLLRECLRPVIEGTWSTVDSPRSIEMASLVLSHTQILYIVENIWDSFESCEVYCTREQLSMLVEIIGDWVQISGEYSLPFGGIALPEQVDSSNEFVQRLSDWLLRRSADFPGIRASIRSRSTPANVVIPEEEDPLIAAFYDTRELGSDWRIWDDDHRKRIGDLLSTRLENPEGVCRFLRSVKRELVDVKGWAMSDPLRIAFAFIADKVQFPAVWIDLSRRYDLFPEASVLLWTAIKSDECDESIVRGLSEMQETRGVVVEAVLKFHKLESELFQFVYSSLSSDDAEYLQLAIHRDNFTEAVVRSLLEHSNRAIRTAAAVAVLNSIDDDVVFDEFMMNGCWRSAMLELEIPLEFSLIFGQNELFEKLLKFAPLVYERLFQVLILRSGQQDFNWRALFDSFDVSAHMLPREAKTRLWGIVAENSWRPTLFRILAGDDANWIEYLLDSLQVDPEFVLDSVNGIGVSPSLEDLARLLVSRGCDPKRIASTVQFGTGFGEQHERTAGYLKQMELLCDSTSPEVRAVGQAGIEYFSPRHINEIREARMKEIRGEL